MLERVAYLNAGSVGPLPRRAAEAMADCVRRDLVEGRAGHAYYRELMELRDRLRESFSRLLGAPKGSVALTSSTTEGCNIVARGLRLDPDDEVVTTDVEHPGLLGALHVSGASIRVARVRERPAAEALAAVEDEIGERTRLVALSHVAFTTGAVLPVRELAGRGFHLLVDGAQSAGAIPVDVEELGCDFYTVSAQKWVLGPDPSGCLYVRPDRLEAVGLTAPSYISWEDPVELVPWPEARRFESAWVSRGVLAATLASLEFAEEVGPERFERARAAVACCRELLSGRAEVVTEPGQGNLVTFRTDDPAEQVVERLAERGVVVRDLPGLDWVRASVGYWTSDDDLERLAAGI